MLIIFFFFFKDVLHLFKDKYQVIETYNLLSANALNFDQTPIFNSIPKATVNLVPVAIDHTLFLLSCSQFLLLLIHCNKGRKAWWCRSKLYVSPFTDPFIRPFMEYWGRKRGSLFVNKWGFYRRTSCY